jgi:uncharacterized protein YndB with AHSA1/START domain
VVTAEVRIGAPPEAVFPFFTDPDKMIRWLGDKALMEVDPAGAYRIEAADAYAISGSILEVDSPYRVTFTWGFPGEGSPLPPGSSTVEVVLTADGPETIVRVTHRDLPEALQSLHRIGWGHYLPRLATIFAGDDPGEDVFPSIVRDHFSPGGEG